MDQIKIGGHIYPPSPLPLFRLRLLLKLFGNRSSAMLQPHAKWILMDELINISNLDQN